MIDKKLGPYTITEEIGAGGMATVYRAYQPSMDRHVAIKVIRTTILQDPTVKDRFRREARLIARLEHPHLLPVYDFDGDHDPPYIVMRYLEGGTLKQVLEQSELPFDEMLYMLNQVGAALDYAHRQGVVHRDLKPSNVMIDREGNAFVTDFGIARAAGTHESLTNAGDLIGTPAYMSPEQARGDADVSSAADVYALGAMVFEMLTGHVPYENESSLGVLMSHVNDPVPSARARNARVPEGADRVIRVAMAKDRSARNPTAGALIADLTGALRVSLANSPRRLQELTETLSLSQLQAFEAQRKATPADTPSTATPTEQQRQDDVRDVVVAAIGDPPAPVHDDQWKIQGCPHSGPPILASRGGDLRVAWFTGAEGRAGVYFRQMEATMDASAPPLAVIVNEKLPTAHVSAAEVPGRGTVIACDVDTLGSRAVTLAYVDAAGRRVSARQQVPDSKGGSHPQIAVSHEGREAFVVWTSHPGEARELRLARWSFTP